MANNATHTPGPWTAKDRSWGWDVTSTNNLIAVVDGPDNHNEANARLIAAAPEMLEALRATVEWMEFTIEQLGTHKKGNRMNWGGPISKARAAIAKAEGKE